MHHGSASQLNLAQHGLNQQSGVRFSHDFKSLFEDKNIRRDAKQQGFRPVSAAHLNSLVSQAPLVVGSSATEMQRNRSNACKTALGRQTTMKDVEVIIEEHNKTRIISVDD